MKKRRDRALEERESVVRQHQAAVEERDATQEGCDEVLQRVQKLEERVSSVGDEVSVLKERNQRLTIERRGLDSDFQKATAEQVIVRAENEARREARAESVRREKQGKVARFTAGLFHYQNLRSRLSDVLGLEENQFPFESKWTPVNSPIHSTSSCLLAAKHGKHLYIVAHQEDVSLLYRATEDLYWERLVLASNLQKCLAIVSHRGTLFGVEKPVDSDYVMLHKLEFTLGMPKAWVKVRNSKCLKKGDFETMFAVNNSIVLVGCWLEGVGYPLVVEYNLLTENWVPTEESKWPQLPTAVMETKPVVTNTRVLLVGGVKWMHMDNEHRLIGHPEVLSLAIADKRPVSSSWRSDEFPKLKRPACGAIQLLGHLVVAGGFKDFLGRTTSYSKDCFAAEEVGQDWLSLPSLSIERSMAWLVEFGGRLLAIGGCSMQSSSTWLTSIESWKFSANLN